MNKTYRYILIAIVGIAVLFGLQYFIPAAIKYLNIPGIPGLSNLPAMPTFSYQTVEPVPSTPEEGIALTPVEVFTTATPVSGTSTLTLTLPANGQTTSTSTLTAFTPTRTKTSSVPIIPAATRTRTRTPVPQLFPTQTKTSTPPQILTATVTAQTTPTATSPFGGTSGGPCDNILYPVRPGQKWLYQIDAQGKSAQVLMGVMGVSGQQGLIVVQNRETGITSDVTVECDNGIIRNFPWVVAGMLTNNSIFADVDVQYISGVLAPNQAAFLNNNWGLAWTTQYTLSGDAKIPFRGDTLNLQLDPSPMTLSCQTLATGAAAFESVSVPLKTYPQALKVACNVQGSVSGQLNGQAVTGTLNGNSTQWFAPEAGLVKMRVDSATITVIGITVSVDLNGQVQLVGFTKAP